MVVTVRAFRSRWSTSTVTPGSGVERAAAAFQKRRVPGSVRRKRSAAPLRGSISDSIRRSFGDSAIPRQLLQRGADGALPVPMNREILRAAGRVCGRFRQVFPGFDETHARGDRPPTVKGTTTSHHPNSGVSVTADRVIMLGQFPHLLEDVVDDYLASLRTTRAPIVVTRRSACAWSAESEVESPVAIWRIRGFPSRWGVRSLPVTRLTG